MPLKEFVGAAPRTTLAAGIDASTNPFDGADGTGYPTGATAPFVIVIDRGLATEEKLLISGRSANTFTPSVRGYDGTVAQPHAVGATIEHALDSITIAEANDHVNNTGRDDHTQYLTSARHDALVTGFHVPTGVIFPYGAAAAPTGYLNCNGAAVSRTTYADLFAIIGTTWGVGDGSTTFNLPDLRGRVPAGAGAGGQLTGITNVADNTGIEDLAITTANMPEHSHTAGTLVTANEAGHAHGIGSYTTSGGGGHSHTTSGTAASAGGHTHSFNNIQITADSAGGYGLTVTSGFVNRVYVTGTPATNVSMNTAGAHTHGVTGTTSFESNHTHNVTGTSGTAGGHSHSVTGSTANAGAASPTVKVVQPTAGVLFIIKT